MIIFNIESKGNLNDKINLINQKLLPFKSRKSSILLQMFEDIKKLLNCFNDKAHSIKKDENIYKEIILYLAKYSKNDLYKDMIDFLNKINVEDEFNKFVIIKNEKYKSIKNEYLKKENMIINEIKVKIKNNQLVEIINA